MTEQHGGGTGRGERSEAELEFHIGVMIRRRQIDIRREDRARAERDALYLRERIQSTHTWMDPEAQWLAREYQELYDRTLASLPKQCQTVFVGVREFELPYALVAARLGISVKMVAKHITQAHREFRLALCEYGIPVPKEKARARGRIGFDSRVDGWRGGRVDGKGENGGKTERGETASSGAAPTSSFEVSEGISTGETPTAIGATEYPFGS